MDRIIGLGIVKADNIVIYASKFLKLLKKKKMRMSFSDDNARPFGCLPIMDKNHVIQYKFYVGEQGATHGSLTQMANVENQKLLGVNWLHEPEFDELSKIFQIQSAGRIWATKKILVMRDEGPNPTTVGFAVKQLEKNGIDDIKLYKLLYSDNANKIHECTIEDYVNRCVASNERNN